MKNTSLIIIGLILLCTITTQISAVLAVSPGVSPGDEFNYDIRIFFTSENQSATISDQALAINSTDYFKVKITEIEEVTVSYTTTWRFLNGTQIEGQGHVNLETGTRAGDFWTIFASNLNAGDRIRPTGFDRTTINYTISGNYGQGDPRQTNVIDITYTLINEDDPNITGTEYSKTYFDRQTGMLVEIEDMRVLSEPITTETLKWKLKETHIWRITETNIPYTIILIIIVVVLLVAGLIVYKKRK
ncbi:hypothetical protein E2P47_04860 [Candidatus Bathyarchaeota archaeon]|nr:hypothetical protein E2P47_04860 [Candidatus Bathyarchaeota archaeon]